MQTLLDELRQGGPAFTFEIADPGFVIVRVDGHEAAFNALARRVINQAGPGYVAFPRPDGCGGYDCVHIIEVD